MQIKITQQFCLYGYLGIVRAKQKAIRNNNGCSAVFLQAIHYKHHAQVGSFTASHVGRKMRLDIGFFVPTIWRIHEYDIKFILFRIVENIFSQ